MYLYWVLHWFNSNELKFNFQNFQKQIKYELWTQISHIQTFLFFLISCNGVNGAILKKCFHKLFQWSFDSEHFQGYESNQCYFFVVTINSVRTIADYLYQFLFRYLIKHFLVCFSNSILVHINVLHEPNFSLKCEMFWIR